MLAGGGGRGTAMGYGSVGLGAAVTVGATVVLPTLWVLPLLWGLPASVCCLPHCACSCHCGQAHTTTARMHTTCQHCGHTHNPPLRACTQPGTAYTHTPCHYVCTYTTCHSTSSAGVARCAAQQKSCCVDWKSCSMCIDVTRSVPVLPVPCAPPSSHNAETRDSLATNTWQDVHQRVDIAVPAHKVRPQQP